MEGAFGYREEPENSHGIIRSRTETGRLRAWYIPRKLRALEILSREFGGTEFPGIYILFGDKRKVYIGEAKSISTRLRTHRSIR